MGKLLTGYSDLEKVSQSLTNAFYGYSNHLNKYNKSPDKAKWKEEYVTKRKILATAVSKSSPKLKGAEKTIELLLSNNKLKLDEDKTLNKRIKPFQDACKEFKLAIKMAEAMLNTNKNLLSN